MKHFIQVPIMKFKMASGVAERGSQLFCFTYSWEPEYQQVNCKRITNTFSATGTICKQPYPTENAFRIITKPVKLFIFHLALVYCSGEVSATLGVTVSESAICKVLEKGSFTHQKLAVYAIQQDEALRQQFVADVSMY